MCGELEPKRIESVKLLLKSGCRIHEGASPATCEDALAVIEWMEAELERARLSVELAEAFDTFTKARDGDKAFGDDGYHMANTQLWAALSAYRAAKAAAHGQPEPPTDLQGG